jgi:MFS transporter, SET family, sugar efflux transporter
LTGAVNRLLVPTAALLWGLQAAFLSPALALILVSLFGASTSDVGWVLSIYNASGFVFSLLLPANADRLGTYLGTMAACGVLTGALALSLALVTTLPLAVVALVVLGGPAGVGSSLLYAHLRHSGGSAADVVNTRAIFSVAWVAGPPLAALIIGTFGNRAILAAIVAVAALNVATTAAMMSQHRRRVVADEVPVPIAADGPPASKLTAGLVMVAFVGLQATNAVAVSIMTIYVTQTMHLDIIWAGIALGVAAGLEVPALLVMGKLSDRHSHLLLIATGCLAGIAYYLGLAFVADPWSLLALQLLNAWFFAAVAGVGLPLFQDLIPRPGLATGLYMNTRRVGAIVSGPIIAIGALTVLGERGIFVACAALTLVALGVVGAAARSQRVPA